MRTLNVKTLNVIFSYILNVVFEKPCLYFFFWELTFLIIKLCGGIRLLTNIFLHESSSIAAKFFEGFSPCSPFCIKCREQRCLKTRTSSENSKDYQLYVLSPPQLQPKRVILSAGGVISKNPAISSRRDNHKSPF